MLQEVAGSGSKSQEVAKGNRKLQAVAEGDVTGSARKSPSQVFLVFLVFLSVNRGTGKGGYAEKNIKITEIKFLDCQLMIDWL